MEHTILRKVTYELENRPEEYVHVAVISIDEHVLCYSVNERSCFKECSCGGKCNKKDA
jgi:hypothetical protein